MRPWRLVGKARRHLVRDRVVAALDQQPPPWLGKGSVGHVDCVPADQCPTTLRMDPDWLRVGPAGQGVYVLLDRLATRQAVFRDYLRGDPRESALWSGILAREGLRFAAGLLGASTATVAPACPPPEVWELASGALLARIHGEHQLATLLLDDGLVRTLSASAGAASRKLPALPELRPGVLAGRVELSVWLGEVELSLAALQGLEPGDLIPLRALIDDPLEVRVNGEATSAAGYLGQTGTQVALILSAK